MSFKVETTRRFEKELKRLTKKYLSLKSEFVELVLVLEKNPTYGLPIGNGFYKIRVSIASKGKGKSGGARAITYVKIVNEIVILATIYDKSEKEIIDEKGLAAYYSQSNKQSLNTNHRLTYSFLTNRIT